MLLFQSLRPGTAQAGVMLDLPIETGVLPYDPFIGLRGCLLASNSWDLSAQMSCVPSGMEKLANSYLFADRPPIGGKTSMMPLLTYRKWYDLSGFVKALFSDWKFVSKPFMVPGENPVLHRNISGIVAAGEFPASHYHSFWSSSGYTPGEYTDEYRTFDVIDDAYELPILEVHASPGGLVTGHMEQDYLDLLNVEIDNGVYDLSTANAAVWFFPYTLLQQTDGMYIRFSVLVASLNQDGWGGFLSLYQVHVPDVVEKAIDLQLSTTYNVDDLITIDVQLQHYAINGIQVSVEQPLPTRAAAISAAQPGSYSGIPSSYTSNGNTYSVSSSVKSFHFLRPPLQRPFFHEHVGYNPATATYYRSGSSSYLTIMDRMNARLPDFVAGTFKSTEDALDNNLPGVDGNYIETLLELQSIMSPLDILKGARMFLSSNFRGGLVKFLELLANANLAYQFGIAPTISDAHDISSNLYPLINRIKEGTYLGAQTLHGKRAYADLDDDIVLSPYTVSCRSKVRLRPSADSLLPFVLPLKALGLLPSMSNLWDLIPYSWLIDDLINISGSLELLDASLLSMAYDVEGSTHSITVSKDIVTEDVEGRFAAIAGSLPTYKLYNRFSIKNGLPVIGPTTLPLIGERAPRWGIYTSVIVSRAT